MGGLKWVITSQDHLDMYLLANLPVEISSHEGGQQVVSTVYNCDDYSWWIVNVNASCQDPPTFLLWAGGGGQPSAYITVYSAWKCINLSCTQLKHFAGVGRLSQLSLVLGLMNIQDFKWHRQGRPAPFWSALYENENILIFVSHSLVWPRHWGCSPMDHHPPPPPLSLLNMNAWIKFVPFIIHDIMLSFDRIATPTFLVVPEDIIAEPGETVLFRCEVAGDPPPDLSWKKQTGELPVGR